MRVNKSVWRGILPTVVFSSAGMAVLTLIPGLLPSLGTEGAESLVFNHPVAPVVAVQKQPLADDVDQIIVVKNWEYTFSCPPPVSASR